MLQHFLCFVHGCSEVSCDLGVFVKKRWAPSFYSSILLVSFLLGFDLCNWVHQWWAHKYLLLLYLLHVLTTLSLPSWSVLTIFRLQSTLSDISIATPTFFGCHFLEISFSISFLSVYVSLWLKWVSCKQYITGSCFLIRRCMSFGWIMQSTYV